VDDVSDGNSYEPELSDWFAAHATDSAYNAHYDRPAVLALVGDVQGQRLLDVGCGAGHYLEELLARGADVVGIDGSDRMVEHARHRVGDRATVMQHDLEQPLTFAADSSFDGAVLPLVLHHIDGRAQLLAELARVLRPGGWLVMSTQHPTSDWRRLGGSYFTRERSHIEVAGGRWQIPAWRMPLQDLLEELLAPGFVLERLVEPRPQEEFANADPSGYRRLLSEPGFLALRLRRG
jgi:SAM-dependent methyltransferase